VSRFAADRVVATEGKKCQCLLPWTNQAVVLFSTAPQYNH